MYVIITNPIPEEQGEHRGSPSALWLPAKQGVGGEVVSVQSCPPGQMVQLTAPPVL